MTSEHKSIKQVFDFLIKHPESERYGFHINGEQDQCLTGVLYHSNGHRVQLRKERAIDPEKQKYEDYDLNPDDFDDNGFFYEYYSSTSDDGFIDISVRDLKALIQDN